MNFKTAFRSADILLPVGVDMTKWAIIACDQFTSEPEYWKKTAEIVGNNPSTLKLVLPEIYLGRGDTSERIKSINAEIHKYISTGRFCRFKDSMIYVERTQSDGKIRRGIVGAIDLEEYDYRPSSHSQVRATEATVVERIPPRLEIRENAEIEIPHIMILIDDPDFTVIEPIADRCASLEKLYDFKLMQGGGAIKGYLMSKNEITAVDNALGQLKQHSEMLFAMGDGNHSLATAKEHYERLKRQNPGVDFSHHPARYALCEIVNLHSDALKFEAIHRFVRVPDTYKFIFEMSLDLGLSGVPSAQKVRIHRNYTVRDLYIENPKSKLAVGSIQSFLDKWIAENGGEIDYIHGEDTLKRLVSEEGTIGFEFLPMSKEELFPAVIADGALPRKTFSMGCAEDKRYYLEARLIVPEGENM